MQPAPRSKDDERSGEYANDIINDWAEDDMAIGGGKVPDPDNAPIKTAPSRGKHTVSGVEYSNGDLTRIESDGSKTTRHRNGTTDRVDAQGNVVHVNKWVKAEPGENGGTDFEDTVTGTHGHFGVSHVRNDPGEIKDTSPGHGQLPDGSRITDETNGSITVNNTDGSTDTWQRDGSQLHTGPGIKTVATPDGGTDVIGPDGKYEAHFGGGETTTEEGKPKYIGGGTVQNPDGSKERGEKPESNSSSNSDNSTDSNSSSRSSNDNADDSSDEDADNNNNDDNADDDSDDNADSTDDSDSADDNGDDETSSDESRGFEGARGSDGGPEPEAKKTVDDRVARMKGEKRDPESPDDSEPGNGGSAPDSVSQPGPGGSHRGSPLARPSADGHQSPVGDIVRPTVGTRSSVGGGDCFKREGCDNAPTGGFQLDPFNRDPVTNPGGH